MKLDARYLQRAVAPNLFTVTLHPEFVPALVAANLLTPRLWEWSRVVRQSAGTNAPADLLRGVHHLLNTRFVHASGATFAGWWGLQECRHVQDPLERSASHYAIGIFKRALAGSTNDHRDESMDPLLELSDDGLFPMYTHGTADLFRGLAQASGRSELGMTSGLDECVLIAALCLALGLCRWGDFFFLGSPFHYTVFIRTQAGLAFFNSRREFFLDADWKQRVAHLSIESRQFEFRRRTILEDRLVTASGAAAPEQALFSGDLQTIAEARDEIESFSGCALDWLQFPENALENSKTDSGLGEARFVDAESVREAILRLGRTSRTFAAALYMFRDPEFCEPELLRHAALDDYVCRLKAATVNTEEGIEALIESIPGHGSLYGPETGRIAMPDEVFACATADDAERELLRETLWHHIERGQTIFQAGK